MSPKVLSHVKAQIDVLLLEERKRPERPHATRHGGQRVTLSPDGESPNHGIFGQLCEMTKMAIAGVMGEGENRSEEEVRKVYLKGALFFKRKKEF